MTDWSAIAAIFGVIAIIVSWAGAYFSWSIARKKATLEFFEKYNQDAKVTAGYKVLKDSRQMKFSADWPEKEDYADLVYLINKLEILAAGVKRNLYDKKMIFIVFGGLVLDVYDEIQSFIDYARHEKKNNDKEFVELEEFITQIKKYCSS